MRTQHLEMFPITAREYFLGSLFMRSLIRVFPNFHECFYNVWNMERNVFYFFHKITRRKLKRGNSLYQSVNSPYRSWWRMRWREPFHVFHTVTETRLLPNQRCHFFFLCGVCSINKIISNWSRVGFSWDPRCIWTYRYQWYIYIERERAALKYFYYSKENWQDGDKQTIRCRSYSNDIRIFTKIIKNIYITETKHSLKYSNFIKVPNPNCYKNIR